MNLTAFQLAWCSSTSRKARRMRHQHRGFTLWLSLPAAVNCKSCMCALQHGISIVPAVPSQHRAAPTTACA